MKEIAAIMLLGIAFVTWRDVAAWLFPVDYERYIRSERWKRKASAARRSAGYRCHDCHTVGRPLDVHHKTYVRLGYEWWFDLVVLCRWCHRRRHGHL